MGLFIATVLVNVVLLVIFQAYKKYGIHTFQAIVFNYLTCIVVGTVVLGKFPITKETPDQPWFPYAIILGFLFITGFTLLGTTVRHIGVTITSIVQKMSLIMPILFGILVFNESVNTLKVLGIICAFISMILINLPEKKEEEESYMPTSTLIIILLVATFFSSGAIDVMLFYVEHENISQSADIGFVVSLFGFAGIIGLVITVIGLIFGWWKWSWKNLLGGIILGIPNFFSIYLLLLMLGQGYEGSILFPLLNVAVIIVSAIIGFIFFKERLSKTQWVGFGIGLLCILLISISV